MGAGMQIAVTNEVFIVDDDPSVRAALSVVLSGERYQVASFVEGEAFLAAARSRTPGCVLLDVTCRIHFRPRPPLHRARIMEKLGAKNAADLMRIVLRAGRGH
jgi:FixJ family two-component response regulator